MNEHELRELCNIFKRVNIIKDFFVVAKDEVKNVKIKYLPSAIIQNTSSRDGIGPAHWIVHVVYRKKENTYVDTFDSTGKSHKIKIGLSNSIHKNVNNFQIQATLPSNICGIYCIWFIFARTICPNTQFNFTIINNTARNDKVVSDFYQKIIKYQNKKDVAPNLHSSYLIVLVSTYYETTHLLQKNIPLYICIVS